MKQLRLFLIAALAGLASWLAHAQSADTPDAEEPSAELANAPDPRGLEVWGRIFEVFSHPRCANCHVGEDNRPLWSGSHYTIYGAGESVAEAVFHGMNVRGGEQRNGMPLVPCSTCHSTANSTQLHGPPGAPHWQLPPVSMQWAGRSSAQVCEQIKDPSRTGGRELDAIADHISHDALIN